MNAAGVAVEPAQFETIACPLCGGEDFEALFEKGGESFVRCRACTLALINPRPPLASIRAGYDAAYSAGYVAKAVKKLRRAQRRVRRLKRAYRLAGRWLDVGCSAGFVVKAAAGEGFEAHGIDIESAGIAYGRNTLGLTHLHEGLLHEARYPNGYFNAISAYDVIEHVPDLNQFVAELKRILHADGVLDIGTPDIGHWRVPRTLSQWNEFKPSEHLYYFDRSTLGRLLARHGLKVDRVRFALKPGLKLSARHA